MLLLRAYQHLFLLTLNSPWRSFRAYYFQSSPYIIILQFNYSLFSSKRWRVCKTTGSILRCGRYGFWFGLSFSYHISKFCATWDPDLRDWDGRWAFTATGRDLSSYMLLLYPKLIGTWPRDSPLRNIFICCFDEDAHHRVSLAKGVLW